MLSSLLCPDNQLQAYLICGNAIIISNTGSGSEFGNLWWTSAVNSVNADEGNILYMLPKHLNQFGV